MRVVITGSTGMIGSGVLLECIDSPTVSQIILLNRTPNIINHPKITQLIVKNLFDLSEFETQLTSIDACFYCLGASISTLSASEYQKITLDLTLYLADVLRRLNPDMTLCFVSGQGVDGTTPSKTMWVDMKGKSEQALLQRPFKALYMFRPGYIQPMRGVKSKTVLYRIFYALLSSFYPILKRIAPKYVTSTVQIGRAMISVAMTKFPTQFLENIEINQAAARL